MVKKPAAKLPANPKAPAKPPKVDWVAVLRSGPAGVRKWNRQTAGDRWQIKLNKADFAGIDLTGVKLQVKSVEKANFAGAVLTGATLCGCFAESSFAGANLRDGKLSGATFPDADFTNAVLAGAYLTESGLRRANFAGADLSGANLTRAELHGADFSTAKLDGTTLADATFDEKTAWPAGFAVPGEAKWAGRGTDPRFAGKGKKAVAADINGLMARLHKVIDEKRMKRTLDMLKSGKNQLFAEVEPTMVRGIVRSQKEQDLVYSCVLAEDGTYACCTPDLAECMGLRGEPCKHILVLLIGLARAGELDATTADKWVTAGTKRNHRWNKTTKNYVSDTLLKYKGVQAGEIDWRPTETIPEDFYAM